MENKKEKHDATQDARKVKRAETELQQRDLTHKGPTYASSPRSILRFTHALPHYISFCGQKKNNCKCSVMVLPFISISLYLRGHFCLCSVSSNMYKFMGIFLGHHHHPPSLSRCNMFWMSQFFLNNVLYLLSHAVPHSHSLTGDRVPLITRSCVDERPRCY